MNNIKVCVFCNKSPIAKNKEHVIPEWLIKLTGNVHRPLYIKGVGRDPKTFDFRSFTFPACTKCNRDFSNLESEAKKVVLSITKKLPLSSKDFEILMDWMDKVRLGVWLGSIMYSKNPLGVIPHFGIATRPRKDRMLLISTTRQPSLRLNFSGFDDPLFHHLPCFFGLYINGISLISISSDGLFLGELPIPNYEKIAETRSGKTIGQLKLTSTAKVKLPYVGKKFTTLLQINYPQKTDKKYFNEEQLNYLKEDLCSSKIIFLKRKKMEIYSNKPNQTWEPETHKTAKDLIKEQNVKFSRLRNWIAIKSFKNSTNPYFKNRYAELYEAKIISANT